MARNWKWHRPEEIVAKLERAARLMDKGASTTEAARAIGVGAATYFRWRKRYSGLRLQHINHIKKLEQELGRLRAAVDEHDVCVEQPNISPCTRRAHDQSGPRADRGAGVVGRKKA